MSYYPHHDPTQPPQLTMPTTPSALSGSNHSTPLNFNSWDMSDPSTGHSELSNAFSNQQDYGSPTQAIQFFQDSASSPTTSSHAQSPAIITLDERPAFLPHERRALARREQAEAQRPARSFPGESRGQSMTVFAGQETLLPLNSPVGASDAKGKAGPARMSPTHIHSERDRAHPYNRPQHAGGSSAIAHSMSASPRSESARRTSDQTHVRFSSGIQAASTPGGASGGAGASRYGVPGGSGDADVGMSGMSPPTIVPSMSGGQSSTHLPQTSTPLRSRAYPPERALTRSRPWTICADTDIDYDTNIMTIVLELPGVQRSDVSIQLTTDIRTKIRQLSVSGTSRPAFQEGRAHTVRERKYGDFSRHISVPFETQGTDVYAGMECGILTIKIHLGPPISSEHVELVQIQEQPQAQ